MSHLLTSVKPVRKATSTTDPLTTRVRLLSYPLTCPHLVAPSEHLSLNRQFPQTSSTIAIYCSSPLGNSNSLSFTTGLNFLPIL